MEAGHDGADVQAGHEGGVIAHRLFSDAIGVFACPGGGDAGFEAADHLVIPAGLGAAGQLLGAEAEGDPKLAAVEVAGDEGEFEITRHDADDEIGLAVEKDFLSEDARVTMETALPGGVAEDGDLLFLIVLLLGEDAAEERLDFESGKDAGAHARRVDLGGIADAGELITGEGVSAERGEAVGVAGVVDDVRSSDASFCDAVDFHSLQRVGEHDELLGMGEGERAQEHAFDDGEDGGGGADAEGEGEDGGEGEAGGFGEVTDGNLQITQHGGSCVRLGLRVE